MTGDCIYLALAEVLLFFITDQRVSAVMVLRYKTKYFMISNN